MPAVTPDITIENQGSVVVLRAASPAGKVWIEEYVDRDGYQPFPAGTRIVDPRCLQPIIDGAVDAGLIVAGSAPVTGRAPVICIRCGESTADGHVHQPRTWNEYMKLAHKRPLPVAVVNELLGLERRRERAEWRARGQADERGAR